jgi:hypothetical protein
MFDIAAIGTATPLLLSALAMYQGLSITASTSGADLGTFPSVPVSILKISSIVSQAVSVYFPGVLEQLSASGSTIHLHWLAIVGALSFISNTLQLIPRDNSNGGKLMLAVAGEQNFRVISVLAGVVKFLCIFPLIFNFSGDSADEVIDTSRLLIDYIVASQLAGNTAEV